ncbi:MAG: hypothetical protein K2G96_01150, partial [Clostridia bacterium]|nr:hypothetical protein [Clostridia bacterium]
MRKKTMAVLLAGAIAAAGIIGLTACKDGDDNGLAKGEQVSEEQWKAAFAATAEVDNYTLTFTTYYQNNATGNVGDKTVTCNYTSNSTETSYYNLTDKKYYSETTANDSLTGGELIGEEDSERTEIYKEYYEASELTVWTAEFDEEANEWDADSYVASSADELLDVFKYKNQVSFLAKIRLATTKTIQGINNPRQAKSKEEH